MSTRGKPRVLLMHPILDPGPAILAEAAEVVAYPPDRPLDEVSIRQAADGCVGIVSQLMDPIRETVLSSPGLKIVSNVAVGFDNIDVAAATANKVMVTNTPGVLDDATSDFAFTLLMATARRVVEADYFTRSGKFQGWAIDMMLGHDVFNATLGIIGIGRIGRGVAHRAKGFNMRVLYYDPHPLPPDAEQQLAAARVDLNRLLAESDFVSVHVPLTQETHHLPAPDSTSTNASRRFIQACFPCRALCWRHTSRARLSGRDRRCRRWPRATWPPQCVAAGRRICSTQRSSDSSYHDVQAAGAGPRRDDHRRSAEPRPPRRRGPRADHRGRR